MELSFEESINEIEKIKKSLENGNIGLDESIKEYEKGMKFINECSKKLIAAEKKLKIIEKDVNGNFTESDFSEHHKEDGSETVEEFKEKTNLSKKKKSKSSKEQDDMEFDLF